MADLQVAKPLILNCGLTLPNRLVKASTSETFAPSNKLPDEKYQNLHRQWAEGGWGMVVTGNVQVDADHLGTHADPAIDDAISDADIIKTWKPWATACNIQNTPTMMQLNHPGRQSPIGAGKRGFLGSRVAPSAVAMDIGSRLLPRIVRWIAFGTPCEMTVPEVEVVVSKFARAARLAAESGFQGVEIHAAHGYLLNQFLWARTNKRVDAYGGSAEKRAKLTVDVIRAIRKVVPGGFGIGIVVSSVEGQGVEMEDCLEQLRLIVNAGVDYVHISGGTFENPTMFIGPDRSGSPENTHEAFFIDFCRYVKPHFPGIPFILTGGFRNCDIIEQAVSDGDCDMVGLARPGVANPRLPKEIVLSKSAKDDDRTLYAKKTEAPWIVKQIGIPALNIHMDNAWYVDQLKRLSMIKAL